MNMEILMGISWLVLIIGGYQLYHVVQSHLDQHNGALSMISVLIMGSLIVFSLMLLFGGGAYACGMHSW